MYWIWGKHAVLSAIQNKGRRKESILLTKNTQHLVTTDTLKSIISIQTPRNISKKVGKNAIHQGMAAYVTHPRFFDVPYVYQNKISPVIICDSVTDMRNIGAICRAISCISNGALILEKNRCAFIGGFTTKCACGAIDKITISFAHKCMHSILDAFSLAGYSLYASCTTSMNPLHKQKFPHLSVFIIGSEDKGVRSSIIKKGNCIPFHIPMQKSTNSLNVSSALSIILHQYSFYS